MTFDITTPVELIKARLQYLETNIDRYSGIIHVTQPMAEEADELRELIVIINNTAYGGNGECLADHLQLVTPTGECPADRLSSTADGSCPADFITHKKGTK